MDKYKNFSVEDFLQDEFFIIWMTDPSSKEGRLFERWLESNEEMREPAEEARTIFQSFNYKPRKLQDEFYQKLKNRIDATINIGVNNIGMNKRTSISFFDARLKMVAVFAGLIIAAAVLFYSLSYHEAVINYYSSKYGETKKLVLPDGSEVTLNANSALKYINSRSSNSREVWLSGEGFFKIRHIEPNDKGIQKFIVHTRDVNVEVVGTEFNVNDVTSDKTEVLLTKGKVRLSLVKGNNQTVNMVPDQLVSYNNRSKLLNVKKVSAGNYICWMDHKYIFEKVTLEDLSKELSRYYGKQVIITDAKMSKQRMSGTLEMQDESTLIQTLSALLGTPVKQKNNQIIIGQN